VAHTFGDRVLKDRFAVGGDLMPGGRAGDGRGGSGARGYLIAYTACSMFNVNRAMKANSNDREALGMHSKKDERNGPAAQRYHHQALCTLVDAMTLREVHGEGSGRRFVRTMRERMPRLLLRMRMAASFRWGLNKSADLAMRDGLLAVVVGAMGVGASLPGTFLRRNIFHLSVHAQPRSSPCQQD
jgi:hypothetical protein